MTSDQAGARRRITRNNFNNDSMAKACSHCDANASLDVDADARAIKPSENVT